MSDKDELPRGLEQFADFWPYYVKAHLNSTNQMLHVAATTHEILFLTLACVANVWFLALVPLSYVYAWIGHLGFEKNMPATFRYFRWSYFADHLMVFYMITGRWSEQMSKVMIAH